MYVVNDDKSIYATRGDVVAFSVSAEDGGEAYVFQPGDVVRVKVFAKKDCTDVVLERDFPVYEETETVDILLTGEDTKIGEIISKPRDYWYEVELNPFSYPQTIIGYDEDGAKVFKLFPEGRDLEDYEYTEEEIPFMDRELDATSTRPVENQAVARAVIRLNAGIDKAQKKIDTTHDYVADVSNEVAVERARIDNQLSGAVGSDAELVDIRVGADGVTYGSAGTAVREQFKDIKASIGFKGVVNLFDKSLSTSNHRLDYSTGALVEADGYYTSGLIDVKDTVYFSYNGVGEKVVRICGYNEAGAFVSGSNKDLVSSYELPDGVSKIRFTYTTSIGIAAWQVQYNGVTEYEAYSGIPSSQASTNKSNIERLSFEDHDTADRIYALERRLGFKWREFDIGKIVFIFDDCRHDLSAVADKFSEKGLPLSVACPTSTLDNVLDNGITVRDMLQIIQTAGGEVFSHGTTFGTLENKSVAECEAILRDSKRDLRECGIVANGFIAPNGIYNENGEGFYQKYYRYGYFAGTALPYNLPRTNMTGMTLDRVKSAVNACAEGKSLLIFMAHTADGTENNFGVDELTAILDYCKERTDVEVTTVRDLYNQYGGI